MDAPASTAGRPAADLEPTRVPVGEIELNVVDAGEGEAVLLLHGFPDSAQLWRHQIAVLREAGYRVVAPDMRGFGGSDAPEGVDAYGLAAVVGDVLALLDGLEVERATVVGHDWGAAAAWGLTALQPGRVEKLVALSVGHPATFLTTMEQRALSWYMLLFTRPEAEDILSREDWRFFREWIGDAVDIERYVEDLSRPGRLTAALNWYRASVGPESFAAGGVSGLPPIECPVMGVWSSEDLALGERQMTDSAPHLVGPWRYERIEGAGHWMPLEAPDRLNELLLGFLGSEAARR